MTFSLCRTRTLRDAALRLEPMAAPNAYELDDNVARVNMDVVWGYLSTEAYWSRWRTREIVEQQIKTAWRVIGVYEQGSGDMVGFARAVYDGCAMPYLADVCVLRPHR